MDELVTEWAAQLYERYSDDICRYIFYIVHDMELAEDLMQETYFRAIKAWHSYKKKANERTWLYTIARNVSIDYLRKKRLIHWVALHKKHTSPLAVPEGLMEENEEIKQLYYLIKKLKRPYREVIYLRKIHELPIKDTATILGWSESKVKNTLMRALRALKAELVKEGIRL